MLFGLQTSETPSEQEDHHKSAYMDSDLVMTCITERHVYARHVFTSVVGWFTFFVTINYASMGWLVGASDKIAHHQTPLIILSVVFVTQNILGIIECFKVKAYFVELSNSFIAMQKHLVQVRTGHLEDEDLAICANCLPLGLYKVSLNMMALALLPILAAWMMFPFSIT